jgi:hypothetical protein
MSSKRVILAMSVSKMGFQTLRRYDFTTFD